MKTYGILAFPAGHSQSPAMQQAAFDAAGIAAEYQRFEIPPEELADFIQRVRDEHIHGLSVSIPHKEAIIPLLDAVDLVAEKIGAVNTVFWDGDKLIGTNTDWQGAMDALAERATIEGKRVTVLGAGGAARAVVYGLQQHGAGEVTVCARRLPQASELAADFGVEAALLEDIGTTEPDIIINTTPLGMAGEREDESPLSPGFFRFTQPFVFDLIYNPTETQLLADARQGGCETLNGLSMFVHQGAAQFRIWTGEEAPVDVMRGALS